ncbi:hypothetical protein GCM10027059_37380 [Myceligenerans halotolerans]
MAVDPALKLEREGYSVRFFLGAGDSSDDVENVDAELTMPDGSRWSATLLTLREVARIMKRWRTSGESGSGSYFQCVDLVLLPEPGVSAMLNALDALVADGGPQGMLPLLGEEA